MARITDARLRADGEGTDAVLSVEVSIDWDRGDDDHRWELVVRFVGADVGARGGDDVVAVRTLPVSPSDGERVTLSADNADGAFDEDRGGSDEIYAACELHLRQPEVRTVETNKVSGNF